MKLALNQLTQATMMALAVGAFVTASPAAAADQTKANIAVAKRFAIEGLGKGDMKAFDDLVAEDIVVTTGLSPKQPIHGRENYKKAFAGFAEAWPVSSFTIDNIFATGDKVVVQFTANAVFRKDYYGVKANNVMAPIKEIQIYTLRKGKIVENVVGAINYPFEFTIYPALKDAVLGDLPFAN